MIGNINGGNGARGLLNYVSEKDGAERIGGTLAGENAREMSQEIAAMRRLKPEAVTPVKHFSLSLPVGERLTSEQWEKVAERYMKEMGFGDSQWVAYRHSDTKKDHIHIVASRIDLNGKLVRDNHEKYKSQAIIRGIERDSELQVIKSSWENQTSRHRAPVEAKVAKRTGIGNGKDRIIREAESHIVGCKSIDEYRRRLECSGIQTKITFDAKGHQKDILYSREGFRIRGEKMGEAFTLSGLKSSGMTQTSQEEPDKKEWVGYLAKPKPTRAPRPLDGKFVAKLQLNVASQRVASIANQIQEVSAKKTDEYNHINNQLSILKARSEALSKEFKTARIKGKNYREEFHKLAKERIELKGAIAGIRINASGEKIMLIREKYYVELRQTVERFKYFGKAGTREHVDALAKIDAKYSKAFEREASSADKFFKQKQEFFSKTGNVTWFSDKRLIRAERLNGVILATAEMIRGVITGKAWRETIQAAQEKWAERSINARFGSDRNRGEAIRDLWKLELGHVQEERAIAFTGLARREAEARASAKVLEVHAPAAPRASLGLAKLPEMNKAKTESLRPLVAESAKDAKTFEAFQARLAERGIQVEAIRRGSHVGLVYAKDGEKIKASSVGHAIKELEEKGVDCGSVRAGGGARGRNDAEAGRGEVGGRPDAGAGREGEASRTEAGGPEPRGTRGGAEAPKPGADLGASRVEPSAAPRDHQRPREGEGRTSDGREDLGRGLEGREGSGAGRDAASLENWPRPDASRTPTAPADRPAEPGRGAEPQRAPDAGRAMDQPGGESGRAPGRAPALPHVQEVSPARAAAEERCDAFVRGQKERIQGLQEQKANLQDRMDQAKDQVGRELKPGEVRISVEDRAGMRDAMAKLDARIFQERSRGQEASVMRQEGRAELWSKGRDLEQQAQALRAEARSLSGGQTVPKMDKANQLEAAAYSLKHGEDQFHGQAKKLGAAQWKVGRLMDGVNRMAKEGHIKKSDVDHIKEGFKGGWNQKQLMEAVKTLEGAGVHRDTPPEKAGQDMLKAACDAVQKCCGKGFDIGKGLEKGLPHSLDR